MVGMRHQEHKVAFEYFASILPSRKEGSEILWQRRAIVGGDSVGVLGWVLPEIAIIDRKGLNDLVIARTAIPETRLESRMMAHDRWPPPGYVECFQSNVLLDWKLGRLDLTVVPRPEPFTDDDIRGCEDKYLDLVAGR